MFPDDVCQRCGHTFEEHSRGLIARCLECPPGECPDFIEEQVPYMGV